MQFISKLILSESNQIICFRIFHPFDHQLNQTDHPNDHLIISFSPILLYVFCLFFTSFFSAQNVGEWMLFLFYSDCVILSVDHLTSFWLVCSARNLIPDGQLETRIGHQSDLHFLILSCYFFVPFEKFTEYVYEIERESTYLIICKTRRQVLFPSSCLLIFFPSVTLILYVLSLFLRIPLSSQLSLS